MYNLKEEEENEMKKNISILSSFLNIYKKNMRKLCVYSVCVYVNNKTKNPFLFINYRFMRSLCIWFLVIPFLLIFDLLV